MCGSNASVAEGKIFEKMHGVMMSKPVYVHTEHLNLSRYFKSGATLELTSCRATCATYQFTPPASFGAGARHVSPLSIFMSTVGLSDGSPQDVCVCTYTWILEDP